MSIAITTIVLGATMAAMNDAIKATDSAAQITELNNGLRTAMDIMVRDAIQVGQGLPTGRVIGLANGAGSTPMQLPGPIGSNFQLDGPSFCPPDPNDATPDTVCEQISAVVPGPGRGPEITEGQPTDMMTIVAADSAFERVRLTAFAANGSTIDGEPGGEHHRRRGGRHRARRPHHADQGQQQLARAGHAPSTEQVVTFGATTR